MPDLAEMIRAGAADPWFYLPIAVVLGALHALEPGHSKSLMAAFIVAIRGTAAQAVMLGVSAAVGHTIVVWGLALIGLSIGDALVLDRAEPWLILVSGLMVVALGLRLLLTIARGGSACGHDHGPHHHDGHGADHAHPHGHHHDHPPREDTIAALAGGASVAVAAATPATAHHGHDHAHHGPDCAHRGHGDDADAHAAAHAREIESKWAGRTRVTPGEIVWFGFTGGLLPCPAAIAVLLICLQLKAVSLGLAMVGAFSLGLAATLVAVGLVAAWGTRRAAAGWSGFGRIADRLPFLSGALVTALGIATALRGLWMLAA